MQLFRESFTDASILSEFTCGLQEMDDFIHHNLQSFLDTKPCNAYCLKDATETIVAFFVLQPEMISIVDDDAKEDIQLIHPNIQLETIEYKTMEIEYLAVSKNLQRQGIGTECIAQIMRIAQEMQDTDLFFLTADAFKTGEYSAVPFYRKCGFDALDIVAPGRRVLPMYKPLY